MSSLTTPRTSVDVAPHADKSTLAQDVRTGLAQDAKDLPPKHLYDELGSQLFDEICSLPEYYPTRTERSILQAQAASIAELTGATELVELGAGTAAKTRVLLSALSDTGALRRYVPFDIEEGVVRSTTHGIATEFPQLSEVRGIVGDFQRDLGLIPPPEPDGKRLVALLGGTIGNFAPQQRRELLQSLAELMGPDDHLLMGADLVKQVDVIEAAYNDSAGVTGRFNLNVLSVINRELDADFQVENFSHVAVYDRDQEWIEMRLRASQACVVQIGALDMQVPIAAGEEIRTEISAKFTIDRLREDFAAGGLEVRSLMTDADGLFALVLARPTR